MKTSSFFAVACMVWAAAAGQDGASKKDLDKLRGTWVTVSLVNNGMTLMDEKSPPEKGPVTKLAYEGTKWMVKVDNKTVASGAFKIDAAKMPKEIDVMDETGMINEKTKLGIYVLDGDTYKFCLAGAGKPRPTEFASKVGSDHTLIVSKREKQ